MRKSIERVFTRLTLADEWQREELLNLLASEASMDEIMSAWGDSDAHVRQGALAVLSKRHAVEYIDYFLLGLKDENEFVRAFSAGVLRDFPEGDVIDSLMNALADPYPIARRNAQDALWHMGKLAVERLIPGLKHQRVDVREAVAWILSTLEDARSFEAFMDALADTSLSVRAYAAEALGKLANPSAGPALIATLHHKDEQLRINAASALGKLRYQPAFDVLMLALMDKSEGVRLAAIEALGELGNKRSVPLLLIEYESQRKRIDHKVNLIVAFGKLCDERCLPILMDLLRDTTEPYAISSKRYCDFASEALIQIGSPAIDGLSQLLNPKELQAVRLIAVKTLCGISHQRSVPFLLQGLKDVDVMVREWAALGLAGMADESAVDGLIEALGDVSLTVRRSALRGLGCSNSRRAFETLLTALADERLEIRSAAIEAFGMLKEPKAFDILVKALGDADENIRAKAATSLGKFGDKRAVEPLILCLQDTRIAPRMNAAEALGNLGDKRAVEPLILCLEQENSRLCRTMTQALGKLGDARAVDALSKLLVDKRHSFDRDKTLIAELAADALRKIGTRKAAHALKKAGFWV